MHRLVVAGRHLDILTVKLTVSWKIEPGHDSPGLPQIAALFRVTERITRSYFIVGRDFFVLSLSIRLTKESIRDRERKFVSNSKEL